MSGEGEESDGGAAEQDRGGEGRGGFPVIVPPPRDGGLPGIPGGPWWVKAGLLALLFLLPVALYGAWSLGWIDLRTTPDLGALLGSGAAPASDTAAAVRAAPADPGDRFRLRADSLSDALGQYGERRSAFGEEAIQCEPLRESHERVERHFQRLSGLYGGEESGEESDLGPERSLRYESLATAVDSVAAHFERSGCPGGGGQTGEATGAGDAAGGAASDTAGA